MNNDSSRPTSGARVALGLIVVSWLPAVGLAQAAVYLMVPLILIAALAFGWARLDRLGVAAIFSWFLLALIAALLQGEEFIPLNLAVAMFTHLPVLLLWVRLRLDDSSIRFLVGGLACVTIFEGVLGAVQLVLSQGTLVFATMAAGDAVVGTLLTNSHMYVVKMLLAAIVLGVAAAFGIMPRLTVVACMTAVVAVVLGSALLVSFLGVVGAMLGLTFITTLAFGRVVRATARLWRAAAIALLAASMLILWTQSDNQNYAVNTGTNILSSILSESGPPQLPGKIQAFSDSLQLLVKNTEIFLVGTGPGHFSSRAALLLSGAYLSNQPSFIPVSVSSYTEQIIIPMWNPAIWSVQFQDGVMNQPWNNVQSVLLETGLLGFSLYVLAFLYLFKLMINRPPWSAISGATRTIGLIVLCITPFVLLTDNWLEFPHAAVSILLPISIAASHKRAWATRRDTG